MFSPVISKPVNVFLDSVYIVLIFCGGVGVVEAQMASSIVFKCSAKIKMDSFGVSNVEVAIGFGGESRDDGFCFI